MLVNPGSVALVPSKRNGETDLSEADDLILPATNSGVGRDVVTRFAFGVLVLAALVSAVHFSDIAELATLARSAPSRVAAAGRARSGRHLSLCWQRLAGGAQASGS